MKVLQILLQAEGFTPRETLVSMTGLKDRSLRSEIGVLRDQGFPVIGNSCDNGYKLAKTIKEYRVFRADYLAKATTIHKRIVKMDKYVVDNVR